MRVGEGDTTVRKGKVNLINETNDPILFNKSKNSIIKLMSTREVNITCLEKTTTTIKAPQVAD